MSSLKSQLFVSYGLPLGWLHVSKGLLAIRILDAIRVISVTDHKIHLNYAF
jgi:hypothetical protein